MSSYTISPITRISGFLKIDIEVEKNTVTNAHTSGTLFRGFESMLIGRAPQDAVYFTQRICGICSTAHSIAASRAIEAASMLSITRNSKLIRNIIHGYDFLQNHIRQIYLFTMPDFVKIPHANSIASNDYRLPSSKTANVVENYYRALEISRLAHQGVSIFGGKAPHNHGIVFGGVTSNIDPIYIGRALEDLSVISDFVENNMQQDMVLLENYYSDYFKIGKTKGGLLSLGLFDDFPEIEISPAKYIIDNISGIPKYEDISEDNNNVNPEHALEYKYNFIKSPRYLGTPMECGPLARAIIRGDYNGTSTMNRIKARAYECILICKALKYFIVQIDYGRNHPKESPADGKGTGYTDSIRGALIHNIGITNGKISGYNIITPSQWNLSPMDQSGVHGPLEESLVDTAIEDINNPIEILRTTHSFDPCVSCATHIYSGGKLHHEYNIMPW